MQSSYQTFPEVRPAVPYGLSLDRGFIAYTADRGGYYDIWLYNLRNRANVQQTNGLGDSFSVPLWSPDSRKIAFVGKNRFLYVISVITGSIACIDQLDEGADFSLNWSSDSKKIAYTKQNHIILYNVMSHRAQKIKQSHSSDVQWFPSGVELLFQAPGVLGISQLFRMRIDGTGKQQITGNTNGPLHDVQLSPDGTFALYTTPGASISIIYTVEISTGNVFEVKGGPLAKNYFPKWSPNSLYIVYSATAYDERRGYYSQIRTVGRRGENDRIWAFSTCFASPVTWSPDGRRIAYLSGCTEQEFANEMRMIDLAYPVSISLIQGVTILSLQWSPSFRIDCSKRTYKNPVYKVQFYYPPHWQKVNDERYQGSDGFLQVSAVSAGENIEEVCRGEAFHQLMPYGSMPRIFKTRIQHQEACFIFPSPDQPAEMMRQAALIVKYPHPVLIQGTTYNYFVLWVDEHHLYKIASTLTFYQTTMRDEESQYT
ncbi:TolB family protein [Bacillus taeanensis]|uniref:Uncharacterized protein n=1 Tax=Bacillus taeanensis TaxID=273032 RepID=A0A366Y082_9BACI|nr:PD40 domain-containing protein [Bacillus taeanensis]RBW69571.1 hypothetical protein DS031_10090 [Bacillus taeanensis]